MSRLTGCAAVALLMAVTLRLSAGTQLTASSSSLSGTVFNAAGNTPVACARVVLQGGGQVLSTRTGSDGRFTFAKIPFRARWIGVEGGGNTVIDDKRFPDPASIQLRSNTGGLLAGVLLDEHHQPIRNIEVTALLRRPQYGRLRFVPVANDVTEADGSYCIQVPNQNGSSEFLVAVIPTGTWLTHPIWAIGRSRIVGHPPTYFPSVTTSAAAEVLTVPYGEARRDVNFSLQTGRVTRIDGDVLNPDVLTLSAADIVLEPPDESVAIFRRATPDASGHFVFNDVPPGEYKVRVFPPSRPEGGGRWGMKQVTIRGESTVHVVVPTQSTQTFGGAASFAGAPAMLPGVPLFFTVNAARVVDASDRFPASYYPSTFSSSDGQGGFTIRNLVPGKYRLSISGADWRGWHLDAITMPLLGEDGSVGTQDVIKTPLIVEPGRDTFSAKVLLSPEVPQVTGVVLEETGKFPPLGTQVIVYPADERKWPAGPAAPAPSLDIAVVIPRADGSFTIQDLPAGNYLAVAVPGRPQIDAALLGVLAPFSVRLTVGGPPATVRLTLTRVDRLPRDLTVGLQLWSKG